MITREQFLRQINRVYDAEHALSREQSRLAIMASEVLGSEYHCDLCEGNELEFRPVDDDGFIDDGIGMFNHTTRRTEDVLNLLEK